MLTKIGFIGNKGVRFITSIIAIVFLLAGFFTLWDMYKTEIRAFASYDLLKFRPDIENNEPPYLDELLKINPDTAAWVTIYGTNIDYPIFQGETDKEYLNKDAYGKFTITGSIFLSVLNKKDFSDPYNLIYGHHMENGSMFGDIDKFNKRSFFFNRKHCRYKDDEGVLIMENKVWNLHVYALIKTDAYDNQIYRSDKKPEEIPGFRAYVEENAKYRYKKMQPDKILALSTCNDATTAARTVLLCSMEERTEPLPTREEEPLTKHTAIGHPMAGAYWAFLNLIALILCIYTVVPLHIYMRRLTDRISKKRKERKEKKKGKGSEDIQDPIKENNEDKTEELKETSDNTKNNILHKLKTKLSIKAVLLVLTGIASLVLFILTEDMHKPLQIVDIYTPLFILLALIAWILRKLIMVRKHGQKKKINKNDSNYTRVPLRVAVSAYLLRLRNFIWG